MKKIILLIIGIILITSSFSTAEIINGESRNKNEKIISFSEPFLQIKENGYTSIYIDGIKKYINQPGKPMLPVLYTTFELKRDVQITKITFEHNKINTITTSNKIEPCPPIKLHRYTETSYPETIQKEDKEIYESNEFFPNNWYNYNIRCGLNENREPTTFVIIEVYPLRYSPAEMTLNYITNAKISISYKEHEKQTSSTNNPTYKLIIISPEQFKDTLEPLVNHKNNNGLPTIIKTTEEIYNEYQGRDKPEQIKYFIKNAYDNWETSFILLVGGLKSHIFARDKDDINHGSTDWHFPVRYHNIYVDGGHNPDEEACLSDLYYGDLYKYNETSSEWEFEDWDSNKDNIFAQWTRFASGNDKLDLIPDISVGRIPCRNNFEVKIIVDKIINYESTSPDEKSWFNKMVGIGGKTFRLVEGVPDGEYNCDLAFSYMGDEVEPVKVYASNRDTGGLVPNIEGISTSISDGAGFVFFQGHGNPESWNTIWHDGNYPRDWIGGISVFNFYELNNKEKLPIIIVGGCHNGLFNVSMLQILLNRENNYDFYWSWALIPFCFSWGLCQIPWGGAIAATGNTGYGSDPSDEIELNFFYQIGQNGASTLGEAHDGAISKAITENSLNREFAFFMAIHQVFGDPSLKIGGYE
jgi:hypothetical protein